MPANYQRKGSGNYIADWVMDVLPYHLGNVEQDVVVETTVDMTLQYFAEHAVSETLDADGEKFGVGQGAMVVVDGTGAVRAMVGGRDYAQSQYNRAVDARRQPGSAFKPFVYLTAIEKLGYRPDTVMIDQPITIGKWSPQNDDGQFRGPVTLARCAGAFDQHRRRAACRPGDAGCGGADGAADGHQLAARGRALDRARHVRRFAA